MSFEENKTPIIVMSTLGLAIIFALLLIPSFAITKTQIIENRISSGNGTDTTECINLASQYQIVLNSIDGNCYIRALANGTGITLETNSTHIIINATSSGGETTVCSGQSGNYTIVASSINGDCSFKNLVSGTGITLSSNGTHITITNSLPENTSAICLGSQGVCVYARETGDRLEFIKFLAQGRIQFSAPGSDVVGIQTTAELNTASNVGSGSGLFKQKTLEDLEFKSIICGIELTCTSNTNDITIDYDKIGQIVSSMQVTQTKTNIGTAYVTVYNGGDALLFEHMTLFDTSNAQDMRILFVWDYVGAGTQQCRFFDGTNVLYESTTFTADQFPYDSGWVDIPVSFENQINATVDWQCKSTTGTDDPIGKGYVIYVR